MFAAGVLIVDKLQKLKEEITTEAMEAETPVQEAAPVESSEATSAPEEQQESATVEMGQEVLVWLFWRLQIRSFVSLK